MLDVHGEVPVGNGFEIGATLDGFRIEERVRAGGMAVLYGVSGPHCGFPLLMKVPRLGHGEPAANLASFETEQQILEGLHGPHAPRLVATGDLAKVPYLVMEYVEGRSLEEWVALAPLAPDEVAAIGTALAAALRAIHAQDVIHLDLKPSNVIVRPGGQAVLVDFGLAHHARLPDILAEEFRWPIGSAPYISPEQLFGVRSDLRSDLFSLGAVLYELATGEYPFGKPTSARGLRARLWRPPLPPRALLPGFPAWLQEVILHCLEVNAGERYQDASQVAFELSNPEQVAVGVRGGRLRRPGALAMLRRRVRAARHSPLAAPRPSAAPSRESIVLAAVAIAHADPVQASAIREAVRRIMAAGGHARLAVVSVVKPTPELGRGAGEETASRQRIRHVIALREWAEPLQLAAGQISLHVVESADPARALLTYARANPVDHIVVGAPPRDVALRGRPGAVSPRISPYAALEPLSLFRPRGTVAIRVAAEAPCTVTVVRV